MSRPVEQPAEFGGWIKQRRKDLDLTQAQLAGAAGCSVESIRKIEGGALRPSRQLAELLAAALEIPAAEGPAFLRFARTRPAAGSPAGAAPRRPRGPLRRLPLRGPRPCPTR